MLSFELLRDIFSVFPSFQTVQDVSSLHFLELNLGLHSSFLFTRLSFQRSNQEALFAMPAMATRIRYDIIRTGARSGGSRYATRAFATPIFVASATPYFCISATQTAATPEILF